MKPRFLCVSPVCLAWLASSLAREPLPELVCPLCLTPAALPLSEPGGSAVPALHFFPSPRVHLQEIFTVSCQTASSTLNSFSVPLLPEQSQPSPHRLIISKCVPLPSIFFSIEARCWYHFMHICSCFCWPNSWLPLATQHRWKLAGSALWNKPNPTRNYPRSVLFVWLREDRLETPELSLFFVFGANYPKWSLQFW